MEEDASEILVGALVGVLALLGLLMASRAVDDEFYVFGLTLAAFSTLFGFGLLKQHFDRASVEAKGDV